MATEKRENPVTGVRFLQPTKAVVPKKDLATGRLHTSDNDVCQNNAGNCDHDFHGLHGNVACSWGGSNVVYVQVCVVIAAVLAIIIYRVAIIATASKNSTVRPYSSILSSLTAAVLQLIAIAILDRVSLCAVLVS